MFVVALYSRYRKLQPNHPHTHAGLGLRSRSHTHTHDFEGCNSLQCIIKLVNKALVCKSMSSRSLKANVCSRIIQSLGSYSRITHTHRVRVKVKVTHTQWAVPYQCFLWLRIIMSHLSHLYRVKGVHVHGIHTKGTHSSIFVLDRAVNGILYSTSQLIESRLPQICE